MNTSQNIHSQSDKNELAKTLAIVCAIQNQYGKTSTELELLVEGISRVLGHRPMPQIIDAIGKFTLKNKGIPQPSDIENIINPPLPKINWALYVDLRKQAREGKYITPDEKKFIADCGDIEKLRLSGEMENYANAQRQLENHQLMLDSKD